MKITEFPTKIKYTEAVRDALLAEGITHQTSYSHWEKQGFIVLEGVLLGYYAYLITDDFKPSWPWSACIDDLDEILELYTPPQESDLSISLFRSDTLTLSDEDILKIIRGEEVTISSLIIKGSGV